MVVSNRAVMPSVPIIEAMSIMLKDRVRSLAVTDNGRLVGQIGYDDVNKAILDLTSTKLAA
jgi:signal-transduction protein with cAMP-binding, CBS, and nucleotidyltransferase domain